MNELGRKSVNEFRQAEKMPVVVVLDNIRSMHNVGSVFRTADAFLVQGICLCGYTPLPPHRDIHKTALGATETVAWRHFPATSEAILSLKEEGYAVFAVEQTEGSIRLSGFGAAFAGASLAGRAGEGLYARAADRLKRFVPDSVLRDGVRDVFTEGGVFFDDFVGIAGSAQSDELLCCVKLAAEHGEHVHAGVGLALKQHLNVVAIDLEASGVFERDRVGLVRRLLKHRSESKEFSGRGLIHNDFLLILIYRCHPNLSG